MPYIPEESHDLSTRTTPHVRLGIMGEPGSGKTWSAALTFPNPVICDFDNNLEGVRKELRANPDKYDPVTIMPFWDANFRASFIKGNKTATAQKIQNNARDVFAFWLAKYHRKFTSDQTLIIDSWTMLQNSFDVQQHLEPEMNRDGTINGFAFWGAKLRYAQEISVYADAMSCQIVTLFHISQEIDNKTGKVTKKKKPLHQGSFVSQIAAHYSNFFEQVVTKTDPFTTRWITRDVNTPVKTDIRNCPEKIPATYQSFLRDFARPLEA